LSDLTKEAKKTNGDGPILPGEDAQDFSDEDSLAEDEGETRDQGAGEDMEEVMHEAKAKEDEEDRMSMDLFGPEMSSQPPSQHFGADTLIALLGRDGADDQHSLTWADEHQDGIFEDFSPEEARVPSPQEAEEEQEVEMTPEPAAPKKSAAELVKEWFPEFSRGEVPRFTEIFGTRRAQLSTPVAKVPKGMAL
jgi:hypothetical protein